MWSSPHRDGVRRHRGGNDYSALPRLTTSAVRNGICGDGLAWRNSTDNCTSLADEYFDSRGRVMTSDMSMATSRSRADAYSRNKRSSFVKSAVSNSDLSSAAPTENCNGRNGPYFWRDQKTSSVVNCSRHSDDDDDDCSNDCDSNDNGWMYTTEWRLVNGRYTSIKKLEQRDSVTPGYNSQDVKRPPASNPYADARRGADHNWTASSSSLTSKWSQRSTAAVTRHRNAIVGYSSCSSSPSAALINGHRHRTAALQRHPSTTLHNGAPRSAAAAGASADVRMSNDNGFRRARVVQVDRQSGGGSCLRTASNGGYSRRRDCPQSELHSTATVGRGSRAPSEPSRKRASSAHGGGLADGASRTGNGSRHSASDWQVANGKNCNVSYELPTSKYRTCDDDVRTVSMCPADGATSHSNLPVNANVIRNSNGPSCRPTSMMSSEKRRSTSGAVSEVCIGSDDNDCVMTRADCDATKRSQRDSRSCAVTDPLFSGKSANEQRVIEELLRLDRTVEDELMELDNDDNDEKEEEKTDVHATGNSCDMNGGVVGRAVFQRRLLSNSRNEMIHEASDFSDRRNELLENCRLSATKSRGVTVADVAVDAKQKDINSNDEVYKQQNQYDQFGESTATGNNNNNDISLHCSSNCEYGTCRAKCDDDKIAERCEVYPEECTRGKLSSDKIDVREGDDNGGVSQQTAREPSLGGSQNADCNADTFSSPFEERHDNISSCHLDVTSSSIASEPSAGGRRDDVGCREAIINQHPPSRCDEMLQATQLLRRAAVEQEVAAPLARASDATKSTSVTTSTMTLRERFQRIVRLVVSSQYDDVFVEPSAASPKIVERRQSGKHGCLQAVAVLDRSSGLVETKLVGRKFCGRWSNACRAHRSATAANNVSPVPHPSKKGSEHNCAYNE
jgi:hypothetical protein